jgi:RNA polymerase sigma factor (sigma-70 family)
MTARNQLIEYYSSEIVPALAASWGRLDFDDACSIGYLATVEAVDCALKTYDVDQQAGIAAYVRQAIVRALSVAHRQSLAIHAPLKAEQQEAHVIPKQRLSTDLMCEQLDAAPNPEELAILAEQRKRLRELFDTQLSPKAATLMTLLYFDGLSTKAAALRFNMTERQIRHLRSTALKVLRNHPEIRALLAPTAHT